MKTSSPAHALAMGRRSFLSRAGWAFALASAGLHAPSMAGAAVFAESRPISIQKAAFFDMACLDDRLLAVGERGVIA
ncbi:MAG: hypothetical protein ACO3SN_10195, partial [Burkholderiaceae bacterium]